MLSLPHGFETPPSGSMAVNMRYKGQIIYKRNVIKGRLRFGSNGGHSPRLLQGESTKCFQKILHGMATIFRIRICRTSRHRGRNVYHLRLKGDHYQMGVKRGKFFQRSNITFPLHLDYQTFVSWLLCMGCCMYNLEDNIPVEIRGCTAFAYSKEGNRIYGRNNDLPPYLKQGSKSELYSPSNGNRFNITTSSFINGYYVLSVTVKHAIK